MHAVAQLLIAGLLVGAGGQAALPGVEPLPPPEVANDLAPPAEPRGKLRIVSFNVHYALDVPALAESIRTSATLGDADVFLIQEIEDHQKEGQSRARRLAILLALNFVYAPARRTDDGGTHGLAILSRYPLEDIEVLPLPQFDLKYNTRRRIALGATVRVGDQSLRVYNLHLDTRINAAQRLEQLRPAVEAALRHCGGQLAVGGDFNTASVRWAWNVVPVFRSNQAAAVDAFMKERGFAAPLEKDGATSNRWLKFRLDALYARGLSATAAGVERGVEVSDHFPVWVEVAWPSER
jgi:endonuclease/exonuclease/phosphatase family metal-dependent hydrolase